MGFVKVKNGKASDMEKMKRKKEAGKKNGKKKKEEW